MRNRVLGLFLLCAAVPAMSQNPPVPKATVKTAKPYAPPKTPWGDPDIQGIWPGNVGVPLQRRADLGERTTLSDDEFAQREAQAAAQAKADAQSVAASDTRPGIGPPSYWTERGRPTRQTSLIIDPPNGSSVTFSDGRKLFVGGSNPDIPADQR